MTDLVDNNHNHNPRDKHFEAKLETQNAVTKEEICKKPVWSAGNIADELFLEMCEGPVIDDTSRDLLPLTGLASKKINKYYLEAAKYAGRISAGNFEGKNKNLKPVFHLDSGHFSQKLKDELSDCLKTSKESLHEVVQEGVFKLFRARHKMIFYEHIEPERLRWEFD